MRCGSRAACRPVHRTDRLSSAVSNTVKPQEFARCYTGLMAHRVNYRHIIDWLVRKPGAFANYRYRKGLFPRTSFRMAYDFLKTHRADKEYLRILKLAATETESGAAHAIRGVLRDGDAISFKRIEGIVRSGISYPDDAIEAIRLALKHKDDLEQLCSIAEDLTLEQGRSVGAVRLLYDLARETGIEAALGKSRETTSSGHCATSPTARRGISPSIPGRKLKWHCARRPTGARSCGSRSARA